VKQLGKPTALLRTEKGDLLKRIAPFAYHLEKSFQIRSTQERLPVPIRRRYFGIARDSFAMDKRANALRRSSGS
jgi:hypothetical protein